MSSISQSRSYFNVGEDRKLAFRRYVLALAGVADDLTLCCMAGPDHTKQVIEEMASIWRKATSVDGFFFQRSPSHWYTENPTFLTEVGKQKLVKRMRRNVGIIRTCDRPEVVLNMLLDEVDAYRRLCYMNPLDPRTVFGSFSFGAPAAVVEASPALPAPLSSSVAPIAPIDCSGCEGTFCVPCATKRVAIAKAESSTVWGSAFNAVLKKPAVFPAAPAPSSSTTTAAPFVSAFGVFGSVPATPAQFPCKGCTSVFCALCTSKSKNALCHDCDKDLGRKFAFGPPTFCNECNDKRIAKAKPVPRLFALGSTQIACVACRIMPEELDSLCKFCHAKKKMIGQS